MMIKQAHTEQYLVPPGPVGQYSSTEDFLLWLKQNLEEYGPLYRASVFGNIVYVVSAPEYCEHILRRNWQNYLRQGLTVKRIELALGNNLITSNGASWASHRRMIHPAFTKSAVGRLNTMMADVNGELLSEWRRAAQRGKTVNITRDVSFMVLKITLLSIFGEDYEAVAPNFEFFAEDSTRGFEFAKRISALRELVLRVATERRRLNRVPSDSLGVMMQARDPDSGEPMSDPELAREILNLVVAGHETTASVLNWIWYLLAVHPEVQTRLAIEFDQLPWEGNPTTDEFPKYAYTRQVIDEALRLYPPLWLMTRRAVHDDRLGEYFVPAGTEIYISPYLIQRNPQLWDVPDHFDPDRQTSDKARDRHKLAACPFGAGPRKCIGDFFALVEMQMHLMMFSKELWIQSSGTVAPEITIGVNLLSKRDFIMLPHIR